MKKNYKLFTTGLITIAISSTNAQCPIPSLVTATPSTICAGATTSLNATATGASINWYDAAIAGTYLGSSASAANFAISPTITTTYYAGSIGSTPSATTNFAYTGGVQNFTVPASVTQLTVDATGAKGGTGTTGAGGNGGRIQTVITVTPGQILTIYVAGAGGNLNNVAGYNGGANSPGTSYATNVGGGGGASDIRIGGVALANRVIVAGGGGGGGYNGCAGGEPGGDGGGLIGAPSVIGCGTVMAPGGGSQVAGGVAGNYGGTYGPASPGTLGFGGAGAVGTSGTGGGGGYYGGGGGSWQGGGGGSSYSSGFGTIHTQGYQAGNGYVNITYPNCVSVSRTAITVTVNPNPIIAVNSGSICSGKSFTITPSGAGTYLYSSGSSVVSPSINTSYTVTGTSALGCPASNTVISSVVVNSLPSVSVNSGAICTGSSFTITPAGSATSYSISGGSAIVTPTANSTYTVTGTNSVTTCSNTAVSTVTVNANPVVNATTSNSLICVGSSVVLTASTSATSYTWNTGATTMSVSVSPTVSSTYTVNVSNAVGCTASSMVMVTVSLCTGVNEALAGSISVYPNPNNGVLNISLTAELSKNSSLEIYDALGKLVTKQMLTDELNTINISNLTNGIYTFKVLNNSNLVKIGKLIKQ